MGEVYRARDSRLGRTVAIKVLVLHIAADEPARERFEREARVVAGLNHPHDESAGHDSAKKSSARCVWN